MSKDEFRKFIADKLEGIRIEWLRTNEPMSVEDKLAWKKALLADMEEAGRMMADYGDMPDA